MIQNYERKLKICLSIDLITTILNNNNNNKFKQLVRLLLLMSIDNKVISLQALLEVCKVYHFFLSVVRVM